MPLGPMESASISLPICLMGRMVGMFFDNTARSSVALFSTGNMSTTKERKKGTTTVVQGMQAGRPAGEGGERREEKEETTRVGRVREENENVKEALSKKGREGATSGVPRVCNQHGTQSTIASFHASGTPK